MDLKILRYFLTVANTKNITKAADLLHITQPTLSRQLILFEKDLGVCLFIKDGRSIELTEAGKTLKIRARELLSLADVTTKELLERRSEVSGNISIGVVESTGMTVLQEIIKLFNKDHKYVIFDMYSGSTDELIEKMESGVIDICLLVSPSDTENFNMIRLPNIEEWGVLMSNDDILAKHDSISIKDLLQLPLILPARTVIKNEIQNWFGKDKYHLNVIGSYNVLTGVMFFAEKQTGYPICLKYSSIIKNDLICYKPIKPLKTIQSVILWKKNRNFNTVTNLFVSRLVKFFDVDNSTLG